MMPSTRLGEDRKRVGVKSGEGMEVGAEMRGGRVTRLERRKVRRKSFW